MEKRVKFICEIEGLEDFKNYAIDTEGVVYSFKRKQRTILSTNWKKKIGDKCYGKYVMLYDIHGNSKTFTIARLVSLAFIPTDNTNRVIKYINGDNNDNRVSNLQWHYTVSRTEKEKKIKVDNFIIENELLSKIEKVHNFSIQKGIKVSDTNTFLNTIVNKALNDYCNQYGLRKAMNNA